MESKRLRMDDGEKSITSPLSTEKKDNFIEISSSHHETDNASNGVKENYDAWHPLLFKREENYEIGEQGLEQRMTFLENDFKTLKQSQIGEEEMDQRMTFLEKEFKILKQSQNEMMEIVKKNALHTCGTYQTPDRSISVPFKNSSTPRSSKMPNINNEEIGRKEKFLGDGDKDPKRPTEVKVRKLFSPSPSSKKKGHDNFVVTAQTSTGHYIIPNTNQGTPKLVGVAVPYWLSTMFKPKATMNITYDECAVACYIFDPSKSEEFDENEVMITIDTKLCQGTRKMLQCFKPQAFIGQDIINLAVSMLTFKERTNSYIGYWFLPSTFSQYVLTWNKTTKYMIQKFKMFMGKVDLIAKIFISLNCKHWFLVVIDLVKNEIVYLDSLPGSKSTLEGRKRSIKKLALYMEDLLTDSSFYACEAKTPLISEFRIVTPNGLGYQADYSNDCAIWVMYWMVNMGSNGYKIDVDDGTRLRIALDLTMTRYNNLADDVLTKSLKYMVD